MGWDREKVSSWIEETIRPDTLFGTVTKFPRVYGDSTYSSIPFFLRAMKNKRSGEVPRPPRRAWWKEEEEEEEKKRKTRENRGWEGLVGFGWLVEEDEKE
ncbi:hypothetical protein M0804_009538 [Polistes exclamans]|nr:hypothetical protein M0804_009538 [Polistes exclamans]